jgi:SAM-dependent methyltransferase
MFGRALERLIRHTGRAGPPPQAPAVEAPWAGPDNGWPVQIGEDVLLRQSFDALRKKWGEIPAGRLERVRSEDLLRGKGDAELFALWLEAFPEGLDGIDRVWYQTLYKDVFRGKKLLDIGCGLAPDTIFYAWHGASVTFSDIVPANVEFARRVCNHLGLKAEFLSVDDLRSFDVLPRDFDVVYCSGSFINMPVEVARLEAQAILQHLPIGGRWVELGYPRARWEREGRLPETEWGSRTDGGAPWIEWHDLQKLNYILSPAVFDLILTVDFHNADFNWFDLVRRS